MANCKTSTFLQRELKLKIDSFQTYKMAKFQDFTKTAKSSCLHAQIW